MKYFFQSPANDDKIKKFRGRKRATIITTLNRDILRTREKYEQFQIKPLKTELDLRNTRVKATNRKLWIKQVKMVVDAADSDTVFQQ